MELPYSHPLVRTSKLCARIKISVIFIFQQLTNERILTNNFFWYYSTSGSSGESFVEILWLVIDFVGLQRVFKEQAQ
jgi:hypothetical protein